MLINVHGSMEDSQNITYGMNSGDIWNFTPNSQIQARYDTVNPEQPSYPTSGFYDSNFIQKETNVTSSYLAGNDMNMFIQPHSLRDLDQNSVYMKKNSDSSECLNGIRKHDLNINNEQHLKQNLIAIARTSTPSPLNISIIKDPILIQPAVNDLDKNNLDFNFSECTGTQDIISGQSLAFIDQNSNGKLKNDSFISTPEDIHIATVF
jgi:hypothetical protein